MVAEECRADHSGRRFARAESITRLGWVWASKFFELYFFFFFSHDVDPIDAGFVAYFSIDNSRDLFMRARIGEKSSGFFMLRDYVC